MPRPARVAAGAQRAGGRARRPRSGLALDCEVAPVDLRPEELLLSRTCRRTTRSASTTCRSTSTAGSTCPSGSGSASSGPTSRRTPASRPTSAASGRIHGAELLASSTTTGPASRCSRSWPSPTSASAEDARAYVQRAAADPRGRRRVRRQDGGGLDAGRRQRVGPAVGHDEPFGTRCEIKNLNSLRSLGRAIEYEARRQVDLLEAGERVVQETRHWDEDDGRTHALPARRRRPTTTGTSPSPTSCRSTPTPAWLERVRAGAAAAARRRAGRALGARRRRRRRPTSAWPCSSQRDQDDLAARRHRRRRRPGAGAHPRRAQPRRRRRRATSTPAALAARRRHGGERRADRDPGQGGAAGRRRAGRPADAAAVAAEHGFEAMDDGRARAARRRGHRRQRRRVGEGRWPATTRPPAPSPATS